MDVFYEFVLQFAAGRKPLTNDVLRNMVMKNKTKRVPEIKIKRQLRTRQEARILLKKERMIVLRKH